MSRSLKLYIAWLVSVSAVALFLTSFVFASLPDPEEQRVLGMWKDISVPLGISPEIDALAGLLFWTVITLFAGALPVRMPRGTLVTVAIAPIIAAMALGCLWGIRALEAGSAWGGLRLCFQRAT